MNHYHHHGMRFPRPRSVGKDSQGMTTGSDYTVVPLSPCLQSPLAPLMFYRTMQKPTVDHHLFCARAHPVTVYCTPY